MARTEANAATRDAANASSRSGAGEDYDDATSGRRTESQMGNENCEEGRSSNLRILGPRTRRTVRSGTKRTRTRDTLIRTREVSPRGTVRSRYGVRNAGTSPISRDKAISEIESNSHAAGV